MSRNDEKLFRSQPQTVSHGQNNSDRRLDEEALPESEKQLRLLFETMHEGFAFHEVICNESGEVVDYRYLDINPAFEELTGLKRENTVGRTVRELIPGIEDEWIQTYGRVALTGEPAERESYVHELDRYYRSRAYSPERGKFAVVFDEVTSQRRVQKELEQRESQLRVLFDSSHSGIILVDTDGRIIVANKRMAEIFGYSLQELTGCPYPQLVHPDEHVAGNERMRQLIRGEIEFVASERHYIRKDGSDFWGFLSGRRHQAADGSLISLVGHITDISELRTARVNLQLLLQQKQIYFERMPTGCIIWDSDFRALEWNPAAERIFGFPAAEAIGKAAPEFIIPVSAQSHVWQIWHDLLQGKTFVQSTNENVTRDGRIILCEWFNTPLPGADGVTSTVLSIVQDISDRKKVEEERLSLERQLLHAQKLESLGVLAGGIAHDFNNILTGIIGNAELALMKLDPESPVLENLARIETAAARAADLARQMLAYSGKGRFIIESIDLNRLVEEMGHMLEVSISKKAVLRYSLAKPLPAVNVDATQVRQIIMNLVINAAEAIGDRSGVIAITTGYLECNETCLQEFWLTDPIPAGLYVSLEIADSGCGMEKDTLARIFDPFFTTKFTGRGLGMAAVLGIVRGHKGAIKVCSEPGKGSSFKVLLPAGEKPAEMFNGNIAVDNWRGSGIALLVDDEETVRAIGAEMLRKLGFEVVTACDGREAVELFKTGKAISVVILDLTMPRMDGEQCFSELRKLDPDVRVIMSSGFSEHEVTQKFVGKELAGFVQKPYKLSALQEVIKKMCP